MVFVAVVTPPPQLNVALAALDEALKVSLTLTQLNTVVAAMLAVGAFVF